MKSLIGMGYSTASPACCFAECPRDPGWYGLYPVPAGSSKGRLEALLNFQTMVADLTGMEIANASLLDEAAAKR